ncbi:hypothetical protein A3711_02810 [Erythrobacter sp. HI00D59]|nr:hypothetical protein A3711_02810 [Erythrobacter sp. HI00D59]
MGADFAGRFAQTGGGLVRNVGSSLAWMVGSRLAYDRGDKVVGGTTEMSIVMANETARIWLDRVQMEGVPGLPRVYASNQAAVRLHAMPPLRSLRAGSGTVEEW